MMKLMMVLAVLGLPAIATAQTKKTTTSPATPAATVAPSKATTDEADQLITNRRLRASEGSLSKWSVSTYWNYSGGSLSDPTEPARPNIVGGGNVQTLQSLYGEIGVKYRLTKLDSLTASTGLFMTTPFHSKIDDNSSQRKGFDENSRKLNIQDPFLKYTHVNRLWGMQSISNIQGIYITNNQLKDALRSQLVLQQVFMKDVGDSGLSLEIGFYPVAEYVINDTYNLRTTFGWQVYQSLKKHDMDTFNKLKVYQSIGLGISVTRDVFLYPNIQFIPSNIRRDVTNIALSANINLF
jgi:hypothetical protein